MEKRIVKKCEEHVSLFKDGIKNWIEENKITMEGKQNTSEFLKFIYDFNSINLTKEDFLKFIYDFNSINLTKEDFAKRKRVKNLVPSSDRCCACRANGEQCTRRKQDSFNFCGTHNKGTPHGTVDSFVETQTPVTSKIEVTIKEIKGIWYYIDEKNNIYKTEDVLSNKLSPEIIGKYTINSNNEINIEFV
jgi:hypothetical protein